MLSVFSRRASPFFWGDFQLFGRYFSFETQDTSSLSTLRHRVVQFAAFDRSGWCLSPDTCDTEEQVLILLLDVLEIHYPLLTDVVFLGCRLLPSSGYLAKMYVLARALLCCSCSHLSFFYSRMTAVGLVGFGFMWFLWWGFFWWIIIEIIVSFPEKAAPCCPCRLLSCSSQKLPFACPSDVASLPLRFEPFELLMEHNYLKYLIHFSTVINSHLRQNDYCSRVFFLCSP